MGKENKLYLFGSRLVICEVRKTTGYCPRSLPRLWLEDFMESRAETRVRGGIKHGKTGLFFLFLVAFLRSDHPPSTMPSACLWCYWQCAHPVEPRLSCISSAKSSLITPVHTSNSWNSLIFRIPYSFIEHAMLLWNISVILPLSLNFIFKEQISKEKRTKTLKTHLLGVNPTVGPYFAKLQGPVRQHGSPA